MRLKILVTITLLLVLGYSFFWYYMAGEAEDRIENWTSRQKLHGVNISYKKLEISGFPSRMEFTLKGLTVATAGRGKFPLFFSSPAITMVAFPWKINQIVVISDGGRLRAGTRRPSRLAATFGKSRSSLLIDMADGRFQRFSLIVQDINWMSGRRKPSSAQEMRLHMMRPAADSPSSAADMELPLLMKVYFEARDVTLGGLPVAAFGNKVDQAEIDLRIHGENIPAYSVDSLSRWRDRGGTFVVKNLEVKSAKIGLELNGEGTLDNHLRPLGAFSSRIYGINQIVDILSRRATFLSPTGKMLLQELKKMSKTEEDGPYGGEKALDLALSLQGGMLFFGPIPVYELPPVIE